MRFVRSSRHPTRLVILQRWTGTPASRRMLSVHIQSGEQNASTISISGGPLDDPKDKRCVLGLDIGGTLTKLVHHSTSSGRSSLICKTWQTTSFENECIPFLQTLVAASSDHADGSAFRLITTGGGAYKFGSYLKSLFGSSSRGKIENKDEMACLGAGLHFLQQYVRDEFYVFDSTVLDTSRGVLVPKKASETRRIPLQPDPDATAANMPAILGNVGSGVSYLLCPPQLSPVIQATEDEIGDALEDPVKRQEPQRVGGTPLGGGTIYGLLRLITGESDFESLLELAAKGDRTKVDLTVGDIYSKAYSSVGLSGDRAAAILGGIGIGKGTGSDLPNNKARDEHDMIQGYIKADVARSVVFGICYNIGLNAVLHAKLNDASNTICFTGNMIHDNEMIMSDIDFGVQVNSNHKMRATFMRHGGYLGAIGAWVRGMQGE